MLDAYKVVAPHVTLGWSGIGGGDFLTKITAAVAGGTPPDMAYLDNQHQGFFGRQKLLVDQGPLGKRDRDFRVEVIEPRALDLYTYDGVVLGYPWALTTGQVFFNRELFRAAGRTTPDELHKQGRWTWPAMVEAAVALTKRGRRHGRAAGHRPRVDLADGPEQQRDRPVRRLPARPRRAAWTSRRRSRPWSTPGPVVQAPRGVGRQHPAGRAALGGNVNMAYNAGRLAMAVRWGVPAGFNQVAGRDLGRAVAEGPGPRGQAGVGPDHRGGRDHAHQQGPGRRPGSSTAGTRRTGSATVLADRSNPGGARVASRSDLQDVARGGLPAPADIWFELAKAGVARPVFPDWNKVNAEIINPGLNPMWVGERTPRDAAIAVAKQLNDFLAANPQ